METQTLSIDALTSFEQEILGHLKESSAGNGHDFGCIEDLGLGGVNMRRARGAISSLVKKDWIRIHETVTTDSGEWTQFTFSDEAKAALGIEVE